MIRSEQGALASTMASDDIRQILVATDFSDISETAVRVAHAYAKAFGARLHVFHVTWPDELGMTALFAALVAELGTVVPVLVASQRGDAAEEIVRYAKGHGIQLIVLGTHGRTGVSRVCWAVSPSGLSAPRRVRS